MSMCAYTRGRVALAALLLPAANLTLADSGIHVGPPKVYDERELTLMLDNLAQGLQGKSFVDAKALADALGNIQGYQNTDFSQAFFANGAVGPGAATVFGGAAAAATMAAAATTTTPTNPITINVSPSLTAGTATTAATTAAAPASGVGPQAPALPALQTPPSYTPTFGANASDLLSDEVNLTYQLSNVRMLLSRSLTDRLHGDNPRLQAVVGFDIDIEPERHAADAVALVEVTANLSGAPQPQCDQDAPLSIVALMPEEGSHNAATLSQKANAFGGAIAASVFSVGYQAQSRSQLFYLYRDMDTLAFQQPSGDSKLRFGWQFRPVLGQHSVQPGIRHMMVVLGLPCSDEGRAIPTIDFKVKQSWQQYEASTHTTSAHRHWFSPSLPETTDSPLFAHVEVPTTAVVQHNLQARVSSIRWIPTDALNGVAVVTGENFFQGTTVRIGSRTYASARDGLTIKSDKELEIAMPINSAVVGGSLSGRYGDAVPLQQRKGSKEARFTITGLRLSAEGSSLYQADAELKFKDGSGSDETLFELNRPVVLLNGVPLAGAPYPDLSELNDNKRTLTAFIPTKALDGGATVFTVSFPFAGPGWSNSTAYYDTTLNVTRLGGEAQARFLIKATNRVDALCDGSWSLELDDGKAYHLMHDLKKPVPARGGLRCIDSHNNWLGFSVPVKQIKPYHHFLMINAGRTPLVGDIPSSEPPPPLPTVEKTPVILAQCDIAPVTFKGTHLDQVSSVLYDKTQLTIVSKKEGNIVVSIGAEITSQPRDSVGLQLISQGHDPVIANLKITAKPNCKVENRKE